ncbi:FAD:protein FMN transferase [Mesorhizobium sp. ES1-1]|nr:FAD:protein FMN transferase [Mesorhizobium sp. ES1-1]
MGMPITVDVGGVSNGELVETVFGYFDHIDRRFSTYRADSEIMAINRGDVPVVGWSGEMNEVLALAWRTKDETDGYFDIRKPDGSLDPSGIVKGWAIRNAAAIVQRAGIRDFFIEAGGDVQSCGKNASGHDWSVGIRNPFNADEIVKIVCPRGRGVATSGTYVRGQHIYNPNGIGSPIQDIVSLTVIGADVLEADRFATAAFAMGRDGIFFIEQTPGLEGYLIDANAAPHRQPGSEPSACNDQDHRPIPRSADDVQADPLLSDGADRRGVRSRLRQAGAT